jgi:hypothetical protein
VIVGLWIVVDDNEAPVGFVVIDQLYVLPTGAVSDDETVDVTFAHCVGVPTVIEPEGVVKTVTRFVKVVVADAHVGAAGFVS